MAVRAWDHPQLLNSEDVPIPVQDVGFPMGLTWLDIDRCANIRIKAYSDCLTTRSVKVHLDAWADTTLYSAGSTWLDVAKNDRDFQYGVFSTNDDHPWNQPKTETCRIITFEKPFAEPPKIVLWLKELDIDKSHNWRVKTYADNITKTGFTLHIDTWGDTILYTGTATWIAHPANRTNIASGTYNTMDVRPWNQPRVDNSGHASFGKTFQKNPLVLTALNWLDIGNTANLRIRALKSNITATGFTWNLDSWGDTTLFSAGASYLAVQDY
ncbi:hypothetical protein FRB96_002269 [Tulasnella sp. 330]|nr:hypothetical protein FRB96_002269 [Tulasnella sp. 330]KAG8867891.1 hypothetical protein FRB97_002896 [Tulasnella sp. 331]KAG8868720.1 hypothetical protein FRB98_003290 [Tulasnella sp. 332]